MINSNKTFISVILPTYNSKKFLKNSISSVLAQSYKNFELIIVDDCSTDGSFSFISKYLKNDHRVKYIKTKKNSNTVGHPRNLGTKIAKGDWIAFIDADDYWYPEKLSEQINNLKNNHYLSCTATNYIKENGYKKSNFVLNSLRIFLQKFIIKKLKESKYYWLYIYNPIIISSVLIKKSFFKDFFFSEDENKREDLFFWLDVFPKVKKNFIFIDRILCTITRSKGSMSSIKKKEFNKIISSISSDFIKKNKFDKFHFFIIGIFLRVFKILISYTYSKFRKFFNYFVFFIVTSWFIIFYTPLFWHIGNKILSVDELKYDNIGIVLISGHDKAEYYNDSYQTRYLDVIKILDKYKFAPKIFLIGRNQILPEQKILKSLLVDYGVKKESIYEIYSTSNNTKENLINISKELKKENIDEITIITSPYHTLRTKLLWNKNIQNIKANLFQIKPKKNNFFQRAHNIRVILYEYIALAYNKFRGWI